MSGELNDSGLLAFLAGLDGAIAESVGEAALDLGVLMEQLAPKDTGDLADSVDVVPTGDGQFEVRVGDGLPDERAAAQEFGTIFQDPQPYVGPSVDAIDPAFHTVAKLAELARRSRV